MLAIFDLYKSDNVDQKLLVQLGKDFLDEVFKTPEFRILQRQLAQWGYEPAKSDQRFKDAMYTMWFERLSVIAINNMLI